MESAPRDDDRTIVVTSFVSFPVSAGGQSWSLAGELRVPRPPAATPDSPIAAAPRAAVLIVHGSAGVDSRGLGYVHALNRAGIATLEIDLWAPRGVTKPMERPKQVAETLPDAFAALGYLAARADIDKRRVGIMGFSWGGVVSMLSATRVRADEYAPPGLTFAAHAPFYPVCWVYNTVPGYEFETLTGAPVFIQAGAADEYDEPETPLRLARANPVGGRPPVAVTIYDGATHAWDRREPDFIARDPMGHLGKGGGVPFTFNAEVTRRSIAATVRFFTEVLA